MDHNGRIAREGVIAGLLGAMGVAVWFLMVDVLAGQPLYTPAALGDGLLGVFGGVRPGDGIATVVALYTVVHLVVFIGIGLLASAIVNWGERDPSVLAGALILFVAFQVLFYGFTMLLAESPVFGDLAWYQVGAANLVAAFLMGSFLLRSHPRVVRNLSLALEGREV